MRLIEGKPYVQWEQALLAGIPKGTLDYARWTSSRSWSFISDPTDRRRVLIAFDTLKQKYKDLIIKAYGNPTEYLSRQTVKQHLNTDYEAIKFYNNYRLADGTGLPSKHITAYTVAAQWLNMLAQADKVKGFKQTYGCSRAEFYQSVITLITNEGVELPCNYSKLRKKLREYMGHPALIEGRNYATLISKRFGNNNSEKLTEEAKEWLEGMYSIPAPRLDTTQLHIAYMQTLRQAQGDPGYRDAMLTPNWQPVTEKCIYDYLHQPEVQCSTDLGRYGYIYWKNKWEHHGKTLPPSFRDALWESDGTKLNFFTDGLRAELNIYKVIDVHSEVILGYDISTEPENYKAQYRAYKNAIKFSRHLPFQVLYDNQGGHKSFDTQGFFNDMAKVHFPARPYNSQSKKIESVIGRFQKQILSRYWFFTGQNITARSKESRCNIEWYMEQMKELPEMHELIRAAEKAISDWNNAPHPKHKEKSRLQVYNDSVNPEPRPVEFEDMVNLFWLWKRDEVTYYRGGVQCWFKKEKYDYEVLNDQGEPDLSLVQRKFRVKYDPEDFSAVILYEQIHNDLRCIAVAPLKKAIASAIADYTANTRSDIDKLLNVRDEQKEVTLNRLHKTLTGVGIPQENQPKYKKMFPAKKKSKGHPELVEGRAMTAAYGYLGNSKEDLLNAETNLYLDPSTLNEGKILDNEMEMY